MTTCWSQEEQDASTRVEQEAGQNVRIPPEPLAPVPDAHIDSPSADRVEEQALLTAGHTRWRASFIGWGVMVVAMVLGTVILFILDAVSLGALVAAMVVAGIVAVVGFGHYLLREGVFVRGWLRERLRFQDDARRSGTSEPEPPGEFLPGSQ
jgi:hypothetical protein